MIRCVRIAGDLASGVATADFTGPLVPDGMVDIGALHLVVLTILQGRGLGQTDGLFIGRLAVGHRERSWRGNRRLGVRLPGGLLGDA